MSQKKDEELFLNGKFRENLLIVVQQLSNKKLITEEDQMLQGTIKECQTFIVASAVIKLNVGSDITFVCNDQNSFILSNIEEGKPFIPFTEKNIKRIIECLF